MTASPSVLSGRRVDAVLFDLDGTLLDTVGDIAAALNRALEEGGYAPRPLEVVRAGVGRGAAVLIQRVLAGEALASGVEERLLERFFAHYEALHETGDTRTVAFPGVLEGVHALHARGLPLGVVTNKRHDLALAALGDAGLLDAFRIVVGGDTCPTRKPDPGPLHYALQHLGVAPGAALMVGDSANDVRAARAAGMPVLCVPYGYTEGTDPRELDSDGMIDSLAQLPGWLSTDPV